MRVRPLKRLPIHEDHHQYDDAHHGCRRYEEPLERSYPSQVFPQRLPQRARPADSVSIRIFFSRHRLGFYQSHGLGLNSDAWNISTWIETQQFKAGTGFIEKDATGFRALTREPTSACSEIATERSRKPANHI